MSKTIDQFELLEQIRGKVVVSAWHSCDTTHCQTGGDCRAYGNATLNEVAR